jgi:hypothetical protein
LFISLSFNRVKTEANADAIKSEMQEIFDRKFTSQWGILEDRILPTSDAYTSLTQFFAHHRNQTTKEKHLRFELYHSATNVDTTAGDKHRFSSFKLTAAEFNNPINIYRCTKTCSGQKEILKKFWFECVHPKALRIWQTQSVMQLDASSPREGPWENDFTLPLLVISKEKKKKS